MKQKVFRHCLKINSNDVAIAMSLLILRTIFAVFNVDLRAANGLSSQYTSKCLQIYRTFVRFE